MDVQIKLTLDVGGEQDNTQDAIESAQNQMRAMDFEELIKIMDYRIDD